MLESVRPYFGVRVALLTILSALFGLFVNSARVASAIQRAIASWSPALSQGEAGYLGFIVRTLLFGLGLVLLLVAVVIAERPKSLRLFFKLGPIDWLGIGLLFSLLALLNVLEVLVLRSFVYQPAQSLLLSLGLPPRVSEPALNPDPQFAVLNLGLLLLIVWVEAPEEIFFRGYFQHHLQPRIGANGALVVSALVWDAWHVFDPAGFVRRVFFGLALGLVFRVRQNTTPLAIGHPVANRLLLAGYLLAPLLRRT